MTPERKAIFCETDVRNRKKKKVTFKDVAMLYAYRPAHPEIFEMSPYEFVTGMAPRGMTTALLKPGQQEVLSQRRTDCGPADKAERKRQRQRQRNDGSKQQHVHLCLAGSADDERSRPPVDTGESNSGGGRRSCKQQREGDGERVWQQTGARGQHMCTHSDSGPRRSSHPRSRQAVATRTELYG